jgi:DNA polymerase
VSAARRSTLDLTRVDPEVRPIAAREAVQSGLADPAAVATAAMGCRACPLWANATQTVFGQGSIPAPLMLVGEQPGDKEDLAGSPFVGPAGRMLDEALLAAGIDRESTFVTNVVKHFKWRPAPSGKRRLHETPTRKEVGACLPWVEAELALVQPRTLVLLGATAAKALAGATVSVTRDHGRPLPSPLAPVVVATVHPSAILRARDGQREPMFEGLVADLKAAVEAVPAA